MSSTPSHTAIPGQVVLPGMADQLGYESIKLDPAQEKFCWELVLNGCNASKAYQRAYPGAAYNTARANASKLLTKTSIINRIEQIKKELATRYTATADDIISYHSRVLMIDRAEYFDERGTVLQVQDMSALARSIVDLDTTVNKFGSGRLSAKIPERQKSAAELARIFGMHKDKVELSGKVDGDGIGNDIERSARIVAIFEAARNRRTGSVVDGGNSEMGSAAGSAD